MRILSVLVLIFLVNAEYYAQETKVLFIGNSYTYVNDLPQTLKNLSLSMGKTVITDQSTPGGYRLMDHASNTTTIEKIFSQQWDYVVLQAQSQEPSWPPSQLDSEVFPYAKQLSDSVKKNRACSEILFFSTWGRENGDAGNCAEWPPVCTFEGMNDRLAVGYFTMAQQNNAAVAPVGQAWRAAREDGLFASMNLYSGDGSHPSVYGTYLTACVFYQSIFRKSIENADYYSTLTQAEAEYLQSVANFVFTDSYDYFLSDTITSADYTFNRNSWYENGVSVLSNFTSLQNNLDVSFSNTSINGENYSWSFGDGEESNQESPIHNYATINQYSVKLITFGQCGIDTTIKLVDVFLNINDFDKEKKGLCFASNNKLYFKNIEVGATIDLFDINGRLIANIRSRNKNKWSYQLKREYSTILIRITNIDGGVFTQKIVL